MRFIATSTPGIVVHPSVPVKDFAEFIKYAQANAEKLSYGSAGPGTVGNLAGELFKQTIKAPGITHMGYPVPQRWTPRVCGWAMLVESCCDRRAPSSWYV